MFNSRPSSPPSSNSPSGASAPTTAKPDAEQTRSGLTELDYWLGKRDVRTIPEADDSEGQKSDESDLGKRDGRCAD